MTSQTFNYSFNITGNSASSISEITNNVTALNAQVNNSVNVFNTWQGRLAIFNQVSQFVEGFSRTVENTLAPGAALNSSIADLSAISGEAGQGLKTIEKYARETATTFGGSAAKSVESYKLLLSQLSPEIAKTPAALKAMGDNVTVLSKTMGGNATAAAEVLTTAMNQYGVSLTDPMEASRKMAEMMNIMAAAGKEGSAELPTIKVALEQCGMAAKGAGVSFVETNAAIQVLDKAGKKGAEGGVALRNVMSILATGRFLPKDVREELQAAGVDINKLTDKSKSLTERLTPLKRVMGDSALFTKLFGRENSNAAMALVQGIDEVNRYSEAIGGTNTAFEQAAIIMDTYNERKSRVQAGFEDFKISVFNATGNLGIWVEIVAGSLIPLAQLMPLIEGSAKAMIFLTNATKMQALWSGIASGATKVWTGIQAAFNFVMAMNPIALVVVAVAALTAGIYVCWQKLAGFRAFIITMWDVIKGFGTILKDFLIDRITGLIDGLGAVGSALMKLFKGDFKGAWEDAKLGVIKITGADATMNALNGVANLNRESSQLFNKNLEAERKRDADKKSEKEGENSADYIGGVVPVPTGKDGGAISQSLAGIGGSADKADKIKNINITIEKLIDKFEIHTTNLHEDVSKVKQMVAEALTGAVNDVNYAM